MRRTEGWLVVADISGYTAFLTDTALEHAQAIIEELLSALHSSLGVTLRIVKLEGDAVLAWTPVDTIEAGELAMRMVDVYQAFRLHVLSIERCMTCSCDACSAARHLDLKFVIHRGELVEQRVGGVGDLQGASVVLVHRLLKNHVVERTGVHAYLLATDAVGLGAAFEGRLVPCTEEYEHFGSVRCHVLDLAAELDRELARHAVRVARDDVVLQYNLPVSVPDAWAWHFDAVRRRLWDPALEPKTAMRLGGVVECTHTDGCRVGHRIVDWRPFRYVSLENASSGSGLRWYPATRTTIEFGPAPNGTIVTHRIQVLQGGLLGWLVRKVLAPELVKATRSAGATLALQLAAAA